MTMEIIYVVGILGCSVVGLFIPLTWKRFLIFGAVLFLAFNLPGFIIYAIASVISEIDDYYIKNPHPTILPFLYNKISERVVVALVLIELILAFTAIAYKAISFLT